METYGDVTRVKIHTKLGIQWPDHMASYLITQTERTYTNHVVSRRDKSHHVNKACPRMSVDADQ